MVVNCDGFLAGMNVDGWDLFCRLCLFLCCYVHMRYVAVEWQHNTFTWGRNTEARVMDVLLQVLFGAHPFQWCIFIGYVED
jgi:hypothetical protein